MCSRVEGVGTFRKILKTRYVLDLNNVFCVRSFSRNLISISKLLVFGHGFLFENSILCIFKYKVHIGGGTLVDSLFKIDIDPSFEYNYLNMHFNVDIKQSLINENSSMLWHRRLAHFSIERIKRLVKDGVLKTHDFTDFGTCVDCIKGMQTNKNT